MFDYHDYAVADNIIINPRLFDDPLGALTHLIDQPPE